MTRTQTLAHLQDTVYKSLEQLSQVMNASCDGLKMYEAYELSRQTANELKRLGAIAERIGKMIPDLGSDSL